jgi:8-oxo-dGTP pyrophosphatase MutT (NUDIX family)
MQPDDPKAPVAAPALPSLAASLLLLRDRPGGAVETLLVQRTTQSRFAGGDHVFPGGKVEVEDVPADIEDLCQSLPDEVAVRRLGDGVTPRAALGFWVGALREAFEEVGVLLAYGPAGGLLALESAAGPRFAAYRVACHAEHGAFFAMLRTERLTLATDRLVYFAHWITPEERPIRYDTRFFATEMPPGQEAVPDGQEIVGLRWMTPAEALGAMGRKEITLRVPTVKNLELVQGPSADRVLEALAARAVPAIRPRLLSADGNPVAILPGDPRWY